jgi:hypothetical protein
MSAKTTRTAIIIAMFSLLAVAVPAGLSQTAFAQSITEEAVEGTPLEGFFDDEITQEQSSNPSQEQTSTSSNAIVNEGDATATSGQNVENNSIEGADCGEALICFGNDLVTDADVNADISQDENNQENDSEQDQSATSEQDALTNAD